MQGQVRPLSDWRDADAYVLLAEPGAGKTDAFVHEAEVTNGLYVTARNFITLGASHFRNRKPIYIDGLDEIRAGSESFSKPLDDIRKCLDKLGCPPFRLSCREADWRSAVDREQLQAVAPRGEIAVLHLAALDDADIGAMLRDLAVPDPTGFLAEAERQGIRALLGNPLLLQLIVRAVGRDTAQWPDSRTAIYQKACEQLASEQNEQHRAEARGRTPSIAQLMDDAGLLYSVCLLAGIAGFTDAAQAAESSVLRIDAIPVGLGITNVRAALSTKLFVADTGNNSRIPQHRTIAEFLAARAITTRLAAGLPVERALSLMSGVDGGIVDPLRGLHAWLTTHCKPERNHLIDRDPLGVALYGDLTMFSVEERKHVLRALHREALRFPWFRKGHWHAQPFGALATPDMAEYFRELLDSPNRSQAHQSLIDCVLEAIEHGKPIPGIAEDLHSVVRDQSFTPLTRAAALDAWLKQDASASKVLRTLLDDIENGSVSDQDDELAGRLLRRLYPKVVEPAEVLRYFHPLKKESLYGQYQDFWRRRLIPATPRESLAVLMEAWINHPRPSPGRHQSFLSDEVSGLLLEVTLSAHGDSASIDSIYRWLGVALDEYDFIRLSDSNIQGARRWLSAKPWILKALVAHGWSQLRQESDSGRRLFWRVEGRTLGATRPADWYLWLLEQAAQSDSEDLARYCFDSAAHLAVNPRQDFEISMETVEAWVEQNRYKWPAAEEWLTNAWTVPLDHWQGEHARENRARKDERLSERQKRRRDLLKHIGSLQTGTAAPGLLNQVALAYEGRFSDIRGETPADRVQDFLGGTRDEAIAAVAGQEEVLKRADLPGVDEILETDLKGRSHYIRPACLLGAALAFKRDPNVVTNWPDELAGKLSAFWLTEGVGDEPDWFQALAAARPSVVAPVMERFTVQRIKKRGETHIPGLWQLARDERFAELARLVVPTLLRAFPIRAKEPHLRILSGELLPAASHHLPRRDFATALSDRLARKNLDVPQRIAYLVAGLTIEGTKYSKALLQLVGKSEARAAHLGHAIEWQGDRRKGMSPLAAPVLANLIELVAPFASPNRPTGTHWVGPADQRRDWVYQFINQLAADPSDEASDEIRHLSMHPRLVAWKSAFQGAAFDQSRAKREATFRQASADEVANVLANRSPANAQDLAALILDQLAHIEARLRGDDTNGLQLFYRDDHETPQAENDCRNVLLERLRPPLLTLGVGLEKEGQAVQGTRVDMRAEFLQPGRRIAVPVEIKKEDNRELWSAWRTQLPQYVLDPSTDGVGIYLILWFGKNVRASPEGTKPLSPLALRDALSATIPEDLRHRLHVTVLDLSFARSGNPGAQFFKPPSVPIA